MAKTVTITCDGCGKDLTYSGNSVDYRLVLGNENKPSRGGLVTAMMKYPPVTHTHYFCDLRCLDLWSDRRRHESALWRDWMNQWKLEKGRKVGDRIISYPDPPKQLREELTAKFKAEALEAFPTK